MKKLLVFVLLSILLVACGKPQPEPESRPQPQAPEYIDTTAPFINLDGDFVVLSNIDSVTATDEYDKNVKIEYTTEESDFPLCHIAHFTAIDSSGNTSSKDVYYILKDEVEDVYTTSTGHTCYKKDGVYYVDGYLVANKSFKLPQDYGDGIVTQAEQAFNSMAGNAWENGVVLWVHSGYRSYNYQSDLFSNYSKRDGVKKRETYSARPGHSEHQSGLAMDLNSLNQSFENTKEFKWLNENAYKYGFVLRYVKYKEDQTGYIYEPWHYRYVGTDLAQVLYNGGDWLTMEEYFGIDSHY